MIDTNILIIMFKEKNKGKAKEIIAELNKYDNNDVFVSEISHLELLIGATSIEKRKQLETQLKAYGKACLNADITDKTFTLVRRYAINRAGNIGLADMIIAAHAIHENLTLYTHNKKDFEFIKELQLHPLSK